MKKSKTLGCVLLAFFLAATLLVAKQKNKAKTNSQTQAKDEQLFAAEPKQYPFTLIAYGDLRTTDLSNHSATNPERRQALIARIATEKPDLLVVNGDLVLSGGNAGDWREFNKETQIWRDAQIKVLPVVGNHDTREDGALHNYFQQFPGLEGRRWYSVRYGNVLLLTLDSESDHAPNSPQWNW
ncbi:MAG: hypothetical protein DMG67_19655, partial [Acidobacteria bacterium]